MTRDLILNMQIIVLELPRRDLLLEQNIQLLKRPSPALRQPEETPAQAHQTNPPKQEPSFPSPVRLVTVENIRHRDGRDDRRSGLYGGGDGDGAAAQTGRRDLGEDHEADGADGHLVGEGPDVHERGHGPHRGSVVGRDAEEADHEEKDGHENHARVVDSAATEAELEILISGGSQSIS